MNSAADAESPLDFPIASPFERAAGWSFVLLCAMLPWAIAPMSIALALCAGMTLLAWAMRHPGWNDRTPVLLPGFVWLAALVLSAAFALNPAASWPRIDKGLLPLLVPMAAWHARRPEVARRALLALLAAGTVCALAGLIEYARGPGGLFGRAHGPVGHYMTYGGQLLMLLSLAVGVALTTRERSWRIAAGVYLPIALGALAVTFTRSAWFGFAAALVALLAAIRPRLLPWLALAAALAIVLAPASMRQRLTSAFDLHHRYNVERTYMWQAGAKMFRERPLTGVGLQDLQALFERYWPPAAHERVGHLHSIPVQIAATMGVVGIAAFVLLYVALLRCATAGLAAQRHRGGLAAGVRLGIAAGLIGFLVAGLFEWNFGDEELLELIYVLAGIAWAARYGWAPMGNRAAAAAAPATPRPAP